MRLVKATVQRFKSIEKSGEVSVDPRVTVLVGLNESGKTAFLQSLYKSRPLQGDEGYDVIEDYPRRHLSQYRREHETNPAVVTTLTYELDDDEVNEINDALGVVVLTDKQWSRTVRYNNSSTIGFSVAEQPFIQKVANTHAELPTEVSDAAIKATSVRGLLATLSEMSLNAEGQAFKQELESRFSKASSGWSNVVAWEVWTKHIWPRTPVFLYFDDYHLLPGKVHLPGLQKRVEQAESNPKALSDEDKTVLGLLRMAGVSLPDLSNGDGYEDIKAKLEGFSNAVTDQVFKFWRQNQELDVEFDIRTDPQDQPPYNAGPNLYIRIKNRRHRVTVPFSQRSKGFIWFFSFLVWFDSVKEQVGANADLILLLDEPGLNLHALAQADFLRYIDTLSERYQTIYTTHSPFMVHSDRLHQVRVVEDRKEDGTVVTSNLSGSDRSTLFPLQAALGYTIAQNLFIGKRNLIVEGPADLLYLRFFTTRLEQLARQGLRDDITIVPAGGLDKVATFVALLGSNDLELVVVHDMGLKPDPRLESLVREKLLRTQQLLNYAQFRTGSITATSAKKKQNTTVAVATPSPVSTPSDVEDLLAPTLYLDAFSATYATKLGGNKVSETDLPAGDRIVDRLNRYLDSNGIQLRPSGGFNHYAVAQQFVTHPPATIDDASLARFETLFDVINNSFSA